MCPVYQSPDCPAKTRASHPVTLEALPQYHKTKETEVKAVGLPKFKAICKGTRFGAVIWRHWRRAARCEEERLTVPGSAEGEGESMAYLPSMNCLAKFQ